MEAGSPGKTASATNLFSGPDKEDACRRSSFRRNILLPAYFGLGREGKRPEYRLGLGAEIYLSRSAIRSARCPCEQQRSEDGGSNQLAAETGETTLGARPAGLA